MKRKTIIVVLLFFCLFVFSACEPDTNKDDFDTFKKSTVIEELTVDNYPKVDGSTSALPLNAIIACKLFGIRYKWVPEYRNLYGVKPNLDKNDTNKFWDIVKGSTTHQSFVNLINGEAEIILSARKISSDEKLLADSVGVSLIETPIALDAFIFIVNENNLVQSLTIEQLQNIYTKKIINWNEVGGSDWEIWPYIREANSGSQELMETLVMKDFDLTEFPVSKWELIAFSMTGAFDAVLDRRAICYTLYYYREMIAKEIVVNTLAINGIYPNKETISNNSYPYIAEVYAVIRSDLDKSSMAYKLYEWLQTEAGKQVISESGYVIN